jgi:hypothetical protein
VYVDPSPKRGSGPSEKMLVGGIGWPVTARRRLSTSSRVDDTNKHRMKSHMGSRVPILINRAVAQALPSRLSPPVTLPSRSAAKISASCRAHSASRPLNAPWRCSERECRWVSWAARTFGVLDQKIFQPPAILHDGGLAAASAAPVLARPRGPNSLSSVASPRRACCSCRR